MSLSYHNFPILFKDYVNMHNLDFVMLFEPRNSGTRVDDIILKLDSSIALKLMLIASRVGFGVCGDPIVQTSKLSLYLNIVYLSRLMIEPHHFGIYLLFMLALTLVLDWKYVTYPQL